MYILKRIISFLLISSVLIYALEENNELIHQQQQKNDARSVLEGCSSKYCMDRGKCQILESRSYCLCQDGYMGQRCEIVLHKNIINQQQQDDQNKLLT